MALGAWQDQIILSLRPVFRTGPGSAVGQQLPSPGSYIQNGTLDISIAVNSATQAARAVPITKTLKPGDVAVETGVYRVSHAQHRLPHEVVVLSGDRFPRCAKCTGAVSFELFYAAPFVVSTYKYTLPVLDDYGPDVQTAI